MNEPCDYIFVSGSSSGLGLGITKRLLQYEKYRVVGIDKSDPAEGIAQERYWHIKTDLSEFEATRDAIEKFLSAGDYKVKGLINAAGIMPSMLFSKVDPYKAADTFLINSVAPLYLSKLLFRHLSRAKPSFIINITSIAADVNIPGEGVYSASKAALKIITEYMSIEYARFGINVNSVAPALVDTPMTAHLNFDQCSYMKQKQAIPREIDINDVTEVIDFLIRAPDSLTGSTFYVGGLSK